MRANDVDLDILGAVIADLPQILLTRDMPEALQPSDLWEGDL